MKQQPYFRVVTNEQDDVAEMYLYGYIGQDFWWSEELREESITDLEFVRKFRELDRTYSRINIRINSPGGSVYHGDPIITAITNSKAEVHTYNDGMAASMAADIWLSGKVRHMARNAKLMIHATSSFCLGTAKDMRACGDMLDKFDQAAIVNMAAVTGMGEEEIRSQFYDYEDHWFTASECIGMGLVDELEDYDVESMEEAEKLSYGELIRRFDQRFREQKDKKGWLQRLQQFLFDEKPAPVHPEKSMEMNIQEFTSSLENGDLTEDQVVEVMQSRGFTLAREEEQPETPADAPDQQTEERIARMEERINSLTQRMEAFAQAPAGPPTSVPAGEDPGLEEEEEEDFLKQFDKQMAAVASQRDRATFTR